MKKFIVFCKSYLAEILFAVLTLLLICGFAVCWLKLTGFVVGICCATAMVLEGGIAYGLSHLPLHRKPFKITLYSCFILWGAAFIIGIILSAQTNKELLSLGTFASVAFCALFTDLVTELPITEANDCDND